MTNRAFLATLAERGHDYPSPTSEDEQWLLDRLAGAAALLTDHSKVYRELLARHRAEGSSTELRAIALDAAGTIAALKQDLRRRYTLVVAAAQSPINPTTALGVLDQLLHSFTLLAGSSTDEYSDAVMSLDEFDELMSLDAVDAWLREVGAFDPASWPLAGDEDG